MQLYTDGTFEITGVDIVYIKKHPYMHNAEDFGNSGYKRPGTGIILTGTQNCILDEHTHNEIVDLAVMLAQSSIQDLNVQGTMNKIGNFDDIFLANSVSLPFEVSELGYGGSVMAIIGLAIIIRGM